jgi:AcrR family transcriptional regulator
VAAMPRTLDAEAHTLKRDAFVDVAQRLIQTRGYDAFSIQDVLDELRASKGAFYHYFGSKADLLEAVIDRMADGVALGWADVMADPTLSATERLEGAFATVAQFKAARKDLVLAVLESWLSNDNAVARDKLRQLVARRMTPLLVEIVRQGAASGEFTVRYPDETARYIVALIQGGGDIATEVYVAFHAGEIDFTEVERDFSAYSDALERILGIPAGRMAMDPAMLRLWFSHDEREPKGLS